MPVESEGQLVIYTLNVGEADTSVILTPGNRVLVIDAVNRTKLWRLLYDLGMQQGDPIAHVVVTHPHSDHYSGVERLIEEFNVAHITFSPVLHLAGTNTGYNNLINRVFLEEGRVPASFLSGYTACYPDVHPFTESDAVCLEMLGPCSQLLEDLHAARLLDMNHRSIIARLLWGSFRMVIAGDAQMENWAHFDREHLLAGGCTVLRAAHHGSANGTQYERLTRLRPRYVYVSSDPNGRHELPDLIGCATFLRYAQRDKNAVVTLTDASGTLRTQVTIGGHVKVDWFGDGRTAAIDLGSARELTAATNPCDWATLLQMRMA